MFEILYFVREDGRSPFREWMERLRDKVAKMRIAQRLRRIEDGNLGDVKPVGEGVLELRVDVGAGYRVYCGRYGESWIVLLSGGEKSTQERDIAKAKELWALWKRRQR